MHFAESLGATPYIPFKANTAPALGAVNGEIVPIDNSAWARMYHFFAFNQREFLDHYHKRSNVETVFSMIKGKFGDAVRSKSDGGMVNEVLAKVLCHNICVLIQSIHELGIAPTICAGMSVAQEVA